MSRGRGYEADYSMSVNARLAYEAGEAPASRYAKRAFFRRHHITAADFKAVGVPGVEHHSSAWFNAVSFYAVEQVAAHLRQLVAAARERLEAQRQTEDFEAEVRWLEWAGSRKHPRATEHSCRARVSRKGSMYTITPLAGGTPFRKREGTRGFHILR